MDGVRSTRLKNMHDSLFDNLNNYKKKIKLTIETNPLKVLDTRLLLDNDIIKAKVYPKPIISLYIVNRRFQKGTKETQ